jgi:phage major head subunit gpT-like protein
MAQSQRLLEQAKIANAQIGFSTVFNNQLQKTMKEPILDIAMRVPSSSATESFKHLGDIPQLREWVDERHMGKLRVEEINVVNKDYATGIRVDKNDIRDDKLNLVMPRIRQLANRAKQHVAKSMVELLLNGFDGTAFPRISNGLSYDGKFLFSLTHQDGEGPEQPNFFTTALSDASYETARVNMQSLQDEEGEPLEVRPNLIIVGPTLERTAREIVEAGIIADGGAGVDNVFKGTADVAISQRLTGTFAAYWFLVDTSQEVGPILWTDREAPRFDALMDMKSEAAFMRKEFQFGTSYAAGYQAGLWQFIHGSDGTS